MGNKSSLNFKPTKLNIQPYHNDRSIKPYYILKSGGLGVECNRNGQEALALRDSIVSKATQDYKKHVGQSFQAKSYLWSAVVNIKPDTTMQDLEQLATHFNTKYGFQCYQIAIHRDEGHVNDEGKDELNQHAHLEFVTLDENTGKSLYRKVTPNVLRQIQTEVADILGMQRGEAVKKSGAKRIEPRAYAQLMNEVRQKHKAEKDNAFNMFYEAGSALSTLYDSDLFTQQDREGLPPLNFGNLESNAKEMTKRAKKRYADRETTLIQQKQELETSNAELNTQLNELKGQHAKELKAKDTELTTLKTTNTQLATQLEELIALFATDKKPTAKELKEKLKEARNQMIAINKLCGEDKLFTQGDYKDIKALEASNLEEGAKEIVSRALERFTTRLVAPYTKEIEELKTASALKDKQIASYKDHLSPEQVEGKITATKEQYKDYLSPKAVQELKQKHAEALETKDTKHAQAVEELKDQHTQDVANLKQAHSTKETQLTQERDKAISQLDSATKTAKELTEAKTKTETALTNLQTAYKALESKYSTLETNQTSNTQEIEDLKANNTLKDKQITRLEAQTAQQQKTITQLEQAIRQVKERIAKEFDTAVAEVTEGLKTQSEAILRQKWSYETARAQLNAKLDTLIERARKDKKLANAIKGTLNKMGFDISLDDPGYFEPSLIDKQKKAVLATLKTEMSPLLEEVSKENAGHVSRLKTAFSSLTSAVEKVAQVVKDSQEYGKQLTAEQEKNEDLTRENNRLKEDLAREQEQNKGARDYIVELNDKVTDLTHKVKELQGQTKDDTPTPTKSKPTPKPTEPQKSPQPTQSTTPKKPLGI
ncbi:hypothetical protein [Helicobacter felis]|uniref:hypothetical protein n=1 Tax=Helicobacter felis TaxID=214 RepID=UPI001F1939E0|nr:hypothetical protein [Helicobacter felis]